MSRPQTTYEVTAPDGTVLEVTGPAGASQEEVIAQAQRLYQPKQDPNAAIKAQQAEKYPTLSETGVTDNRTATEVARDQALQAVYGGLMFIPGLLKTGGKLAYDTVTGNARGVADTASDMAAGTLDLVTAPVRGAAAYVAPGSVQAPSREQWEQHAQSSGANLVAAGIPLIPKAARAGVGAITSGEGLMTRAGNLKAAAKNVTTPPMLPTSVRSAVVQGVSRSLNPARRMAAAASERVARWLTKNEGAPMLHPTTGDSGNLAATIAEVDPPALAALRRQQAAGQGGAPGTPPSAPPVNASRPGRPDFYYEGVFTPEELALRPQAGRGGPGTPIEMPEGFGTSATEKASGPLPHQIRATERAIRPTGRRAQQSTIHNIPQLAQAAPELFPITYETFPAKAVKSLERTTKAIESAESSVPRTTTVPRQPILDGFAKLAEEYKARGIAGAEAAIEKVAKKWAEAPEQIPWERFVKMKRGFFEDANVNSGPMLRAYGHLMDASSQISKELAAANRNYAAVRRALQDGGVDIKTGRRIREVGKK